MTMEKVERQIKYDLDKNQAARCSLKLFSPSSASMSEKDTMLSMKSNFKCCQLRLADESDVVRSIQNFMRKTRFESVKENNSGQDMSPQWFLDLINAPSPKIEAVRRNKQASVQSSVHCAEAASFSLGSTANVESETESEIKMKRSSNVPGTLKNKLNSHKGKNDLRSVPTKSPRVIVAGEKKNTIVPIPKKQTDINKGVEKMEDQESRRTKQIVHTSGSKEKLVEKDVEDEIGSAKELLQDQTGSTDVVVQDGGWQHEQALLSSRRRNVCHQLSSWSLLLFMVVLMIAGMGIEMADEVTLTKETAPLSFNGSSLLSMASVGCELDNGADPNFSCPQRCADLVIANARTNGVGKANVGEIDILSTGSTVDTGAVDASCRVLEQVECAMYVVSMATEVPDASSGVVSSNSINSSFTSFAAAAATSNEYGNENEGGKSCDRRDSIEFALVEIKLASCVDSACEMSNECMLCPFLSLGHTSLCFSSNFFSFLSTFLFYISSFLLSSHSFQTSWQHRR